MRLLRWKRAKGKGLILTPEGKILLNFLERHKEPLYQSKSEDAYTYLSEDSWYMINVKAYVTNMKVAGRTSSHQDPDEKYMRYWEDRFDIPEQTADDFRRQLVAKAGSLKGN